MLIYLHILQYLYAVYESIECGTDINVILVVGVSTIISVMAVALPLLVNSISGLDKRYNSTYVVNVFCKDWTVWLFIIMLCVSICNIIVWTVAYFCRLEQVQLTSSVTLLAFTSLLIASTICLIVRIVLYGTPAYLFRIIKKKERRIGNPKHYFDRMTNAKTIEENAAFDRKTNRYYSILACLYIEAFRKGNQLQQAILDFWNRKCTPDMPSKKTLSNFDNSNITYVVHFPECYYYFIREVEKWALAHEDKNSSYDGIVLLTRILLTGHMPVKDDKLNKKVIWTYSFETLDSMWKSMRNAVDNGMEQMFRRYWQIINNNALRRYSNSSFPLSSVEALCQEQRYYNRIQFLTCAYLIYRKSYGSLLYALNYTQSSRLQRHVLPNNISELLNTYVDFRFWYSNLSNQHYYSFSDDYQISSSFEAVHHATWLAALMFVLFWDEAKQNGEELNKKVLFRHWKTDNVRKYLQYLLSTLVQLRDNTEHLEWLKAGGLTSEDVPTSEECQEYINAVIRDHDRQLDDELRKRPVQGTARTMLLNDAIRQEVRQAKGDFKLWRISSPKGKSHIQSGGLLHVETSKRLFIQDLSDTEVAVDKMHALALQWKYQMVALLREYFINKASYQRTLSVNKDILTEVRREVSERYPVLVQYNNLAALDQYTRENVKKKIGKELAAMIIRWAGIVGKCHSRAVVVSFIPDIRTLLGMKDCQNRFHGILLIDGLNDYRGSKQISDRYRRYLYDSVFVVRKADLPYINWKVASNRDLSEAKNLGSLDASQNLYVNIRHKENSPTSEVLLYKPYEIFSNDAKYVQIRLDMDRITFQDK